MRILYLRKTKAALSLILVAVLILATLGSTGCVSVRRTPNLEKIFSEARTRSGKRPVIVIPGILGTELINSKTGEKSWPSAFRTADEGLPISPDLAANKDDLVPGKILETLQLAKALPEVYVYRDLLQALRTFAGYREADWNSPGTDGDKDAFYVFAYDWRHDNVTNARELVRRIKQLKETLHRPDLKFNIIAHSMGGLIARYAAMYGNEDLPGGDGDIQPTWAGAEHISKIVMIGVPNEGSADALATLIEGYSITEGIRRRIPLLNKLTAEDAVRSPSVFQLLPHAGAAKFLDENLKELRIDLYDPEVWRRYGWTPIFNGEFQKKLSNHKSTTDTKNLSMETLNAYFEATLKRTRRFHQALDAGIGSTQPVTLLAIGGDCEETLNAPVILRDVKKDRWVTLLKPREFRTSNGTKITKKQTLDAMFAPGDGRVTRKSLLGEIRVTINGEAIPTRLSIAYSVFGCDLHGQLQRNKMLQDNALTAIVGEVMK